MVETASVGWTRRSAWADVAKAGRFGAQGTTGVVVELLYGLGIATLIVADGGGPALAAALRDRIGIEPPLTPLIRRSGGRALAWAGPDRWMLVADRRDDLDPVCEGLHALAAVSNQSDGWASLQIGGPDVRRALAKGVMLDLHPSAFPDGAVALTAVSHINVVIWREGDAFTLLAPRSMAGSIWSWLSASTAEFGCEVRG
ncbi:sarcosine oxidase subunit gamma [Alsobacter metallidurans]|uniref:Sarcosine oxidase subunit gamma n=1 Tax=Alsobacter metallidurans TaxID=340221 RepID=A0A917I983_9HYPH|nr:sarcosine oxidase subunit gamma family protein [Alsobacter metallidurans]GGH23747.1 sarcosine oxidase subunit gamma [Alsobacter metallidurans]